MIFFFENENLFMGNQEGIAFLYQIQLFVCIFNKLKATVILVTAKL